MPQTTSQLEWPPPTLQHFKHLAQKEKFKEEEAETEKV